PSAANCEKKPRNRDDKYSARTCCHRRNPGSMAEIRAGAVQNSVTTFDRGQGRPYLSAEGGSVRRRGRNRLCVHVPEPDGRAQHLTRNGALLLLREPGRSRS